MPADEAGEMAPRELPPQDQAVELVGPMRQQANPTTTTSAQDVDRFFSEVPASAEDDQDDREAMIERLRADLYTGTRPRALPDALPPGSPAGAAVSTTGRTPRAMGGDGEGVGSSEPPPQRLGTFKGVFIPCLQNILGVILFLRLTWITAQAGTYLTSAIILICAASTFLTALSLSAIATNGRVAAGGPYFLISRNLGPEVGTAVGLLFYLGTTIAASMYVLGAVEGLYDGFSGVFDGYRWESRTVTTALGLMLLLAAIVRVGVKQVNQAASVFLGVVIFSVVSSLLGCTLMAAGGPRGDLSAEDRQIRQGGFGKPRYQKDDATGIVPDFQFLLSVFYPSVTGIMAGSNRSGVLASASRSIPTGTLAAIGVTTVLYLVVVWLFGLSIDREILYEEEGVVALVAWPSVPLVKAGIVCSTVGAALQSLTGAPRLLYAIAADGTLPFLTRALVHKDTNSHDNTHSLLKGGPVDGSLGSPAFAPHNAVKNKNNASIKARVKASVESLIRLGAPTESATTTTSPNDDDDDDRRVAADGKTLRDDDRDDVEAQVAQSGGRSSSARPSHQRPPPIQTTPATQHEDQLSAPSKEKSTVPQTTTPSKKKKKKNSNDTKKKADSDVTPLAVGATWFVASLPCFAGNLTLITPVVTMFFLLMYATVNFACFSLAYLRSPGFRPTWRYFHWSSALLGFVWCVALMFAISWYMAIVAMAIGASVALYVRKEGVNKDWGDAGAGLRFQIARDQLLALTEQSTFYHAKNWRPQLLVLLETDERFNPKRPELLVAAGSLNKGNGLLMALALIDAGAHGAAPRAVVADAATEVLRLHLDAHHIRGFPRAVVYRHRGSRAGTHIAAGDAPLVDPPFLPNGLPSPFNHHTHQRKPIFVTDDGHASTSGADDAAAARGDDDDDGPREEAKEPQNDVVKRKALIVDDRRALMDAILSSAQSCGIGALRPNTLLLGWPTPRDGAGPWGAGGDPPPKERESTKPIGNGAQKKMIRPQSPSSDRARRADFVQLLRDLSAMRKALVVVKGGARLGGGGDDDDVPSTAGGARRASATSNRLHHHQEEAQEEEAAANGSSAPNSVTPSGGDTVDVWWVVQDGGLLLLLPWLMQRSKNFSNCRLRVFAVMTGLFAHHWNATHGGALGLGGGEPGTRSLETESTLLRRFEAFVHKLLADLRIDAEIRAVAGLDFVWAAAHVYRDTLGLRGRTTYLQQLSTRRSGARSSPRSRAGAQQNGTHNNNNAPFSPPPTTTAASAAAAAKGTTTTGKAKTTASGARDADAANRPVFWAGAGFDGGSVPRGSPAGCHDDSDAHLAALRGFASALNGKMRERSRAARIVVTNLPYMTHLPSDFFVDYVDDLTDGLDAVMLVRGSGKEVVTKYG